MPIRFYGLVSNHYFDDVAFHRAIKGFVAQFGIHGDTVVNHAWEGKNIMDDPVKTSNKAGTLSFARAGVNSRSTQMFFNLADNQPLDTLSVGGFPPIGHVIKGIEVLTQINTEYSTGAPGPDQGQLAHQGNAYLRANFPRIDYIKTARIATTWKK